MTTATPSTTRPRAARDRVWRGPQAVAAMVVLAVMAVWRAVLLGGSFFNQDDYYLTTRAYDVPLSADFLIEPVAGHVNPAQQLAFWLVANGAPFDWAVLAVAVLVMQGVAAVLMWHVLTRLLPGRWVRVPLLAVFAWSPLTLMTTLWWSAAIALWPHVIFSLLAVLFLVRLRQGAGKAWVNYAVCVLAVAGGLLWHERAVLIPTVLLGVGVLLADEAVGWRRVPAALRRSWPLWTILVAVLAGFLLAHRSITSVQGGGTSVRGALSISWAYVGENVLPGLASGPWTADLKGGAVMPPLWVTVLTLVLTAAVVTLLLRYGGPARRWALAFLVAYVAADLALVLAGRGSFGRVIGQDPRYASDIIHVAVVAVALALRGSPRGLGVALPPGLTWERSRTVVLLGATTAYLVGSAFGSAALVPHFQNPEDRTYVTNLRAGLAADPDQVVFDALVPPEILLPLVGRDSLLSRVFLPLPESPAFDQPSARMVTVARNGRLVPMALQGSVAALPGPVPSCGYAVKSARIQIPFALPVTGRVAVRVGYFTDAEATVDVSAGEWTTQFRVRPGPNVMWLVMPDQGRPVPSVRLRVDGASTMCVTTVQAGLPAAAW